MTPNTLGEKRTLLVRYTHAISFIDLDPAAFISYIASFRLARFRPRIGEGASPVAGA